MGVTSHIKKCIKVSVFMILMIPAFIQISYLSRKDIAHTTRIRAGFYALKKNSLDVCIVGTSGTFSAYCPMQAWNDYGFTSYNFCVNCMGSDTFVYALKEVLKTQKPEVIMIDVYPFVIHQRVANMTSKDVEYMVRYNTDGYRYSFNRCKLIHDVVPNDFNKIPFYFDILKYGGGTPDYSLRNFACNNFRRGYSNLPWQEGHHAIMTNTIKPLEPEYENDFEKLLLYCKEIETKSNTKILFLYYPYGNARDDSIEYLNYIKNKVKSADFDFFDCEEIIDEFNFDYMQDFWGEAHWNIFGAEKITKVVSKHLVNMFHFEDKRTDKKYKIWNDDMKEWNKYVQEEKAYIEKDRREKTSQ